MPGEANTSTFTGRRARGPDRHCHPASRRQGREGAFEAGDEAGRIQYAHIAGFYECITEGGGESSDITVGATAALTAILGHEAMVKQTVVNWSDMGVDL